MSRNFLAAEVQYINQRPRKLFVAWCFLFAAVALAAGAITGARSWAIGAGAGVAAASFVVQAVANNSEDLADLERFSPFFWAYGQSPLGNGFDAPGLALLWGFALAFVAVATFALRRRDILG